MGENPQPAHLEQGGRPEATLWLQGFRGPANTVALGLGVMMHSFELDDYHSGAKLHPGAVVIPAALAVAERQGASGRDVLRAIVAGYELRSRTSLAAGALSMRRRGWHITGLCGTFGAAAAAGHLLGLDSLQMANALGLAGTQSAGLFAFTCDGANSKRLYPGRAAQSGVFAAELVARGFTGPTAVLEYEDGGFCCAVADASHLELLTRGLGEDYVTAGVSLKPYACCGSMHSSIDAVR
ncbi:MAG TPA: MmgE/PrpD family protein [Candidatus Tectomicrobia bacterium]